MAELLDRIQAEIRERLASNRAAAQEYERLEAALAALGAPAARPRRAAQPRAPRGANRDAVLRALEERPGASASELATASGVNRTVLYGVLNRLIDGGEVAKEELPGGATGYKLRREEPSAFPVRRAQEEPDEPGMPAADAAADEPPPLGAAPDVTPDEPDESEPPLAAAA